jgi:hypothetical protein
VTEPREVWTGVLNGSKDHTTPVGGELLRDHVTSTFLRDILLAAVWTPTAAGRHESHKLDHGAVLSGPDMDNAASRGHGRAISLLQARKMPASTYGYLWGSSRELQRCSCRHCGSVAE